MKDKTLTISLYVILALVLGGLLISKSETWFARAQDQVVTKIKQVENY